MKQSYLNLKNTAIFALLFFSMSCQSNKNNSKAEEESGKDSTSTPAENVAAEKIVYSIPSPIRVVSLLKRSGSHYIDGIINSDDHVKSYTQNSEMALNLGIYGTDLAYTCLFDQTQASIKCMKASKSLAEAIGISSAFSSNNLLKRFEANLSKRDSLLGIVSELYREAGNFLEENDNKSGAALMLAGGWIEGLFIATRSYEKDGKKDLAARIAEQKLSLENLLSMLKEFKDQPGFAPVMFGLEEIKTIFEKSSDQYTEKSSTQDAKAHSISLNSENTYALSEVQVKEVSLKIQKLRNTVVKNQ